MNEITPKRTFRPSTSGDYAPEELELANRNHGFALEALRYDVTPLGLHYLLIHFDIPPADPATWSLAMDGLVNDPVTLSIAEIEALPQRTRRVTLECAGNGRAYRTERYQSMPWRFEAVGTAEWTGASLSDVIDRAGGLKDETHHVVFEGADRGIDGGKTHNYARALTPEEITRLDPILATRINGMPLPPQHGAPLRLVVPGWYGMASVKWLTGIRAIDHAFQGHQQVGTYVYRETPEDTGTPVRELRVKSLINPPGIPNFYGRTRHLEPGPTTLSGRAWSGEGVAIKRVDVEIDGTWQSATLDPAPADPAAWRGWHCAWDATPGEHTLRSRATDANGMEQPLEPVPDVQGFGNNAVHQLTVTVR